MWLQVKLSSAPTATSVDAGRGNAFAVGVRQCAEFQSKVAGVLDDDLVFDFLTKFAAEFARAEGAFAGELLLLFDREGRFGGDFGGGFVGGLGAGAFVAFDRGFVHVGADGEFVRAGEELFVADGEFSGAGRGEAFAAGVFDGGEFERHVAGVADDDLVFDDLAEFARVFGGGVGAFARDPLLLLDDEVGFGGDFGGDFVGGLGARAFGAFDRGFVARRCRPASLWLQVKLSSAPGSSSVAPDGAMPSQLLSFSAPNFSFTLPVFLTMILYSTFWFSLPVTSPVV